MNLYYARSVLDGIDGLVRTLGAAKADMARSHYGKPVAVAQMRGDWIESADLDERVEWLEAWARELEAELYPETPEALEPDTLEEARE